MNAVATLSDSLVLAARPADYRDYKCSIYYDHVFPSFIVWQKIRRVALALLVSYQCSLVVHFFY